VGPSTINLAVNLVDELRVALHRADAAAMRQACDRLVGARLPPERVGPMKLFRQTLDRFERLAAHEKEREVAKGLRLCAHLGNIVGTPREARPAVPSSPLARPAQRAAAGALEEPVTSLPGIGPTLARRLAERELLTVEDLAWFVPRRYDDLRQILPLADAVKCAQGERVTIAATVTRATRSRFKRMLVVELADGPVGLTCFWFNANPSLVARFPIGRRVILSGPIRFRDDQPSLSNAEIVGDLDDETTVLSVRPRYAEVEGVAPAIVRKACRAAIAKAAPHIVDGVPPGVIERVDLPPLGEALTRLHTPPEGLPAEQVPVLTEGDSRWHHRLAFDELFFLALAIAQRRVERRRHAAAPCVPPPGALAAAHAVLPFRLTSAQQRSVDEIAKDLTGVHPMNRLLQGDVGSGKTAVAFAAAHLVISSGRQVALMAPTEILAEQHLASLTPWANALGHRIALLTASTPRGVRESTLQMLSAGVVHLVIGTHALLAERVAFSDLGLAIVDEQHRFGVAQRVRLRSKGEGAPEDFSTGVPHLLVMTATPIPRTLALTVYGDLDVSTLDELPPGRTPARTKVVSGAKNAAAAYKLLKKEVTAGARAFVVCPLIEPSPDADGDTWIDATTTAARLAVELAPLRVGLCHGRMPFAEREAAMSKLRSGELQVLVATTVIEVGVDVPQARVMVVEDADRFGLAQLHQLRGRVGRAPGAASHCLLLTRGRNTADATDRLAVMAETTDGFKIAEEDLRIRGPGELFGVKQAGLPRLRFGDLVKHARLAALARREAERLLDEDPTLDRPEHAITARVLAARLEAAGKTYGGEGG
jgi:ATP-dependent DNA helicase RecG